MDKFSLNIPDTNKPRVVIIGGGFGGINAVKNLDSDFFQIVLFDKHNYHTFQPLLYQVASGSLQPDAIAGQLRKVFKNKKDFYFRMLEVKSVDTEANIISTVSGDLRYDYLIIANGTKSNFFGNEQVQKFSLPLKTVPDALDIRTSLMQLFESANLVNHDESLLQKMLTVVIVGGGPTGVETAGAVAELRKYVLPKDYPQIDFSKMQIYVLEGMEKLLPTMSPKAGASAYYNLSKMGVIIKLKSMVENYNGNTVTLKGGEEIGALTVIWSAGVTGILLEGLKKEWSEKGRLLVNENCKIIGSKNIFAIGDMALMKSEKYPKGHPGVAQPAIQMGKYIGKNLKALHENKSVKPFSYFDKGNLATIGRGKAVADLPGNIHTTGRIAWWIWLFVHISFLISFRNKILVFANWLWNYFTFDKGNRFIMRPFAFKNDKSISADELLQDAGL